jgi:hypothetical protein
MKIFNPNKLTHSNKLIVQPSLWLIAASAGAVFAAILLGGASAQAQNSAWPNNTDPDDYSTASEWDTGVVPTNTSGIVIFANNVIYLNNGREIGPKRFQRLEQNVKARFS